MITSIQLEGLAKLHKKFENLKKEFESSGIHLYRAKKFRQFTIEMLKANALGLKPISGATNIIDEGNHPPEYNTGGVVESMGTKERKFNTGGGAVAGYFGGGPNMPNKKVTLTQAVILQHTGFRIPSSDDLDKYNNVVKFYAKKGVLGPVFLSFKNKVNKDKNAKYFVVPPRPFLFRAEVAFRNSGADLAACKEYLSFKHKEWKEQQNFNFGIDFEGKI